MLDRLKSLTSGFPPWQIAAVLGVFIVTAIGAIALAWVFRRWNKRSRPCVKQSSL